MRQHDLTCALRVGCRDADELEVQRAVVVQDVQHVLAVDDGVRERIVHALAARPDGPQRRPEVGGIHEEFLARDRRLRRDDEVAVAAREAGPHPVPLVGLVEELLVGRGIRPDLMEPHGVGSPCVVDRGVHDEPAVGGEHRPRRGLRDDVAQIAAAREVADAQRVALVALRVDAVEQARAVGGHVERAQREELVPLGLDVAVQEHLLTGDLDIGGEDGRRPVVGVRERRAAVDAVLAALDRAAVVPPRPPPARDGQVGLEGAALDLLIDPLLQGLQVRGALLRVGVLGAQMREDLLIVLRAQPFVGIDDVVAVVAARGGAGGDGGGGGLRNGHRPTLTDPPRSGCGGSAIGRGCARISVVRLPEHEPTVNCSFAPPIPSAPSPRIPTESELWKPP